MPAEPPQELVALLERLGLATHSQVRGVGHRVHRLARELPLFESVWVDALAQDRIVTPYQAAQINAGRGEQLVRGDFLLCHKLPSNGLGQSYVARDGASGKLCRLLEVRCFGHDALRMLGELESLVKDLTGLDSPVVLPPEKTGTSDDGVWTACKLVEGRVAAEWLAHNGRMPPEAVLEVARRMLPGLVALEARARVHGDLGAQQLLLTENGGIWLSLPGVRGIVRPAEGYAHADLCPEAYDYLAPERVLEGTPPTIASDMFALGCLWWHLLAGRAPLAGGDGLSKLRSAQAANIVDIRQLAPDTPEELIKAITVCTARDPKHRPASMAWLLEIVGPGSRAGRDALVRCLQRSGGVTRSYRKPRRAMGHGWASTGKALAATAAVLLLVIAWLGRPSDKLLPLNSIPGERADRAPHQKAAPSVAVERPQNNASRPAASEKRSTAPDATNAAVADLVLPADEPLRLRDLPLRPGQRVCGPPGQRPLILVPAQGISIACDDVQFDGLDFALENNSLAEQAEAIVHVRADRVSFHGCSFQCSAARERQRTAILWHGPPATERHAARLPTGAIKLTSCSFRNVATAIECRPAGALRLSLTNTLHLGAGPLVRFARWPGPDEPRLLALNHCTLRGAGAMLEYRYERTDLRAAETTIDAVGCMFALEASRGLIGWRGPADPTRLLKSVHWTGEGSVVTPPTALCVWHPPECPDQTLPDDDLSVSGLVLSQVTFAGPADAGADASCAQRWQAPLQSADPPGIAEGLPAWPELPNAVRE